MESKNRGRPVDAAARQTQMGRILAAAQHCFVRDGFGGASIAQICAEAGLSPGSLYQYFKSKDEIVIAMVEADRRDTLLHFARWLEAGDLAGAMLADLGAFFSDRSEENIAYARLAVEVLAEAGRNEKVAARVREAEAEARQALAQAIEAAPGPRPNAPAEDVAVALLALYDGLLARFILANDEEAAQLLTASRAAIAALLPAGKISTGWT